VPLPTIVHLDADAFFVSVELAKRPELRGKSVAVGGRERGIISSASYEARAAGVYTPMPSQRALKVCPDLILLPHEGDYGGVSRQMFDRCEDVTPLVQRNSIDEGYLDLGPCALGSVEAIEAAMRSLQHRIWAELGIPVSMGLATNRLVAQIASKLRKPRGFVTILDGEEKTFMAPLDIKEMPGVGPKTQERMRARNVHTMGDVVALGDSALAALVGSGWREFRDRCAGIDERPVETERGAAKSYSHQQTFRQDLSDRDQVESIAKGLIDDLMAKVRADGKRVRTLTVLARYGDFSQESAGRSLPEASDLETAFYPLMRGLLAKAWRHPRPIRLISVRLSGVDQRATQLDIFAQNDEKRRRLAGIMDQLNADEARGKGSGLKRAHQLGKRPPPNTLAGPS
jgi:DNA polymerase IV